MAGWCDVKIKLLSDYRGALTEETFYRAGVLEVDVDIPVDHALALIHAGRAVEAEAVRATVATEPAAPRETKKRRGDL